MSRRYFLLYFKFDFTFGFSNVSSGYSEAATRGVLWKKVFLENFTKFTGKHLCQILFFNKVVSLRPATLLQKRLWHRCFPLNFAKFLRLFFYSTPLVAASKSINLVKFWIMFLISDFLIFLKSEFCLLISSSF